MTNDIVVSGERGMKKLYGIARDRLVDAPTDLAAPFPADCFVTHQQHSCHN
jgi:hypothetical protein